MKVNILLCLQLLLFTGICLFFFPVKNSVGQNEPSLEIQPEIREKIEDLIAESRLMLLHRPDSSMMLAKRASELATKFSDSSGMAKAYFLQGENFFIREQLVEARTAYLNSLGMLTYWGNEHMAGEIFLMLGRISLAYESYYSAMTYMMRSLDIAERTENLDLSIETYNWIAISFKLMGSDERFREKTVETLINLAELHYVMKEYEKAEEYYLLSIDELSRHKDSGWIAGVVIMLGDIKFELSEFESAKNYYREALELTGDIDDRKVLMGNYFIAEAYIRLARISVVAENYFEAKDLLKRSLNIAEKNNYNRHTIEATLLLSNVYESIGNQDSAFLLFKYHDHLRDSIYNLLNISEAMSVEMEYNHHKALELKRMTLMQQELEYREKFRFYQFLTVAAILLFVIAILLFVIFRIRQQNRLKEEKIQQILLLIEKEKLAGEVDSKESQLSTSLVYLLKNNNFLINFAEQLKEAINLNKHNNLKEYRDLLKKLNDVLTKESWDEFEVRFNKVHRSFNENLLKDFPDLTPNDLKLCALLRLNMTTKDIETITYQSANAIGVARHRLRAKLGLGRDENLVAFLSKY
jgi:tetratricopeptide (TPR) repeat protein